MKNAALGRHDLQRLRHHRGIGLGIALLGHQPDTGGRQLRAQFADQASP